MEGSELAHLHRAEALLVKLRAFGMVSWFFILDPADYTAPARVVWGTYAAVVVYTIAAGLFGISVELRTMAGILPVIFFGAAVPGPMRTVAITLWVVLFPGYEGEVTTFAFLQHNFFVFFNAAIGLVFLRRAYRDLFDGS